MVSHAELGDLRDVVRTCRSAGITDTKVSVEFLADAINAITYARTEAHNERGRSEHFRIELATAIEVAREARAALEVVVLERDELAARLEASANRVRAWKMRQPPMIRKSVPEVG